MIGALKKKIGVKVAVLTNIVLMCITIGGGYILAHLQGSQLEEQLLQRGKIQSVTGAVITGRILEEAIDNGVFTINDLFDTDYKIISGFTPPKYHTKYDVYLDKALLSIMDAYLTDTDNIFAIAVDKNGYCPVHNTRFQQPITGDSDKDMVGNRTKRIFNDAVGKRAALNSENGFRQIYYRDTGEEIWDISSPVYVRGRHWGGFRVGVSLEKIKEARNRMVMSIVIVISLIMIVSFISVFFTVNKALKPLRRLTQIASQLADGDVTKKIKSESEDETGQLSEALERLRMSLYFAMKKLNSGKEKKTEPQKTKSA